MSTDSSTFSGSLTLTATSNQLILGTTTTTTLNAATPAASRVYNFIDAGANCDVVLTAGTQTIGGAKTWSGDFNVTGNITMALPIGGTGTTGVITAGGIRFIHNYSTSTSYNLYVGVGAGNFTTTGTSNCFIGSQTATLAAPGAVIAAGSSNTVIGCGSCGVMNSGSSNTVVGAQSCTGLTTGSNNIIVGTSTATGLTTGNNNVIIGNSVTTAAALTNSIVISTRPQTGVSNRTIIGASTFQTSCAIFGISGATSTGGVAVFINSSGILGTLTSSQRFKENIIDLPDSLAQTLLSVPLKQFTYISDPAQEVQYGAIAETVLPLWPEVIAYEEDGVTPNTIQYQKWLPVLIKINQLQQAAINTMQSQIAQMQADVAALQAKIMA